MYELLDGKPIYYRGYKSVLNNTKKFEDIMGSSGLQSVLINFIATILHQFINQKEYWIMLNEAGIHLDHKNNLAGDILIYEKSRLKGTDINTNYLKVIIDWNKNIEIMKGIPVILLRNLQKLQYLLV